MKKFIVEVCTFNLKIHQMVVEIHQNAKFLVFSLILSRISPLSFQKSKSLRLCVVKFFRIYFWEVYIISYLRKIISYFLDAWLWKNSLLKCVRFIWKFIKWLLKSIKMPNFLFFHWFWAEFHHFSFQKSKSLRLCVVKFFRIYFWEVYIISYLRKII